MFSLFPDQRVLEVVVEDVPGDGDEVRAVGDVDLAVVEVDAVVRSLKNSLWSIHTWCAPYCDQDLVDRRQRLLHDEVADDHVADLAEALLRPMVKPMPTRRAPGAPTIDLLDSTRMDSLPVMVPATRMIDGRRLAGRRAELVEGA